MSKSFYWLILFFVLIIGLQAKASVPVILKSYESGNPTLISDTTATDTIQTKKQWDSSDTYISGSVTWKNNDGNKNVDFDLRFGINLKNRLNELDLRADAR